MLKIYLLVWNIIDLSGMMVVKNRMQFDDHPCLFSVKSLSKYTIWGGVGVNYTLYID